MTESPESSLPEDFDLDGARKMREMLELNPFLGIIGGLKDIQTLLEKNFAFVPPPFELISNSQILKEFRPFLERAQRNPEILEKVQGYNELKEEIDRACSIVSMEWNPSMHDLLTEFMDHILLAIELWDSFLAAHQYHLKYPDRGKVLVSVTQLMHTDRNGVFGCLEKLELRPESFANLTSLVMLIERSPKLTEMRRKIQLFIEK